MQRLSRSVHLSYVHYLACKQLNLLEALEKFPNLMELEYNLPDHDKITWQCDSLL